MKTIQQTCGTCAGIGNTSFWVTTGEKDKYGNETTNLQQKECPQCGGKGYTEYAVFTVEEAQAILKHCGIITGEIGDI
jgi:hypothetical protein